MYSFKSKKKTENKGQRQWVTNYEDKDKEERDDVAKKVCNYKRKI